MAASYRKNLLPWQIKREFSDEGMKQKKLKLPRMVQPLTLVLPNAIHDGTACPCP